MQNPSKTGDLKDLRSKQGPKYLNFIEELTSVFTEPGEKYGKIKVTKRKEGITKIRIKDSDTGCEVDFIYRNRDMYIIGIITGSTPVFYIDEVVYSQNKPDDNRKKIPSAWANVIGAETNVVALPELNYINILPEREKTRLHFGKLGESLKELTQLGNRSQRFESMKKHFAPFVVAFSEAIRFPVLAREVQKAIRVEPAPYNAQQVRREPGTIDLDMNIVEQLSLGHPDKRDKDIHIFTIYSLLMNWGDLSYGVGLIYKGEPAPPITDKHHKYSICLDKTQADALLGVAQSQRILKK